MNAPSLRWLVWRARDLDMTFVQIAPGHAGRRGSRVFLPLAHRQAGFARIKVSGRIGQRADEHAVRYLFDERVAWAETFGDEFLAAGPGDRAVWSRGAFWPISGWPGVCTVARLGDACERTGDGFVRRDR